MTSINTLTDKSVYTDQPSQLMGSEIGSNLGRVLEQSIASTSRQGSLPKFSLDLMPELSQPMVDTDSMMVMLSGLSAKLTELQLNTSMEATETQRSERRSANEAAFKKLQDAQAKAEEARKNEVGNKVATWFKTIFAVLGAVLGVVAAVTATGATFGAGAPLIVAAVIGMTLAVMELATTIMKEANVQAKDANGVLKPVDVTFGGIVDRATEAMIANGNIVKVRYDESGNAVLLDGAKPKPGAIYMDEKQISEWKMGWSTTSNLLAAGAALASGLAGMAAMNRVASQGMKLADAVKDSVNSVERVTNHLENLSMVGEGVATIAEGANSAQLAVINRDTSRLKAEQLFFQKRAQDASMRIAMTEELVKELVEALMDSMDQVSTMVANVSSNRVTIARNMG